MGNDIKRVVNTRFWDDDKVINEFSPEDKYFMLYLLTNKHTTQLGIYTLVPKQAAFELGYSVEAVLVLLDRFEHKYGIIQYSKETSEIAVRNYLFHSVIKGGKPVMDCLLKEEKDVINRSLLWFVLNGLERKRQILPKKMNETVLAYMDHLKEERTKEENPYKGYQQVNINNNDNDNERYVHESSTNRQQINNELSEIAERFNEIKSRVISESIVMPDRGDERCEWCGNMVINLEKHHFPIPKRSGGNEVVHICHDCHKKFHDIETNNSRVKKRFIPPTIEEVDAYCLEKNLEYLDPVSFVEFYESKNWMVGKIKMTNWHSAASGWNRRASESGRRKYVRKSKPTAEPIVTYSNRPERWKTCPESTWLKLKPFANNDGSFDWGSFDPSVLNEDDKKWMKTNDM